MDAKGGFRKFQQVRGRSRKLQGSLRKFQEVPGGAISSRRLQDAAEGPGSPRMPQDVLGSYKRPRKPQKLPGGARSFWVGGLVGRWVACWKEKAEPWLECT